MANVKKKKVFCVSSESFSTPLANLITQKCDALEITDPGCTIERAISMAMAGKCAVFSTGFTGAYTISVETINNIEEKAIVLDTYDREFTVSKGKAVIGFISPESRRITLRGMQGDVIQKIFNTWRRIAGDPAIHLFNRYDMWFEY